MCRERVRRVGGVGVGGSYDGVAGECGARAFVVVVRGFGVGCGVGAVGVCVGSVRAGGVRVRVGGEGWVVCAGFACGPCVGGACVRGV